MHSFRYESWIWNANNLQQATQMPIIPSFRYENNRWGPTGLGSLKHVQGDQSVYLLLFELSRVRACSVWGWAHPLVIQLFEFDLGLHCSNRPEVFIPHSLLLYERFNKFVVIRGIFVRYQYLCSPVGFRIPVWNVHCCVAIYLLFAVFIQLMTTSVNGVISTLLIPFCQNTFLVSYHICPIISFQYDACWGLRCLGDYYKF